MQSEALYIPGQLQRAADLPAQNNKSSGAPAGGAGPEGGSDAALALGQGEDLLLDAVAHEQAQQPQGSARAGRGTQQVRAAERLHVRLGVPVGIQDDDRADCGQVDAQAARARRQQEQKRFAANAQHIYLSAPACLQG